VATSWWETINNPQAEEIKRKMVRPEEVAEAVRWALTKPDRIQIDEVMIKPYRSPWEGV
jgi:NADP-dependent 3-hydroxy acid dehydrogenase YdfG